MMYFILILFGSASIALGYQLARLCWEEFSWSSFKKKPKPESEPFLPSELDDWDAQFTELTGKSIWQARCEADPELCKSRVEYGALNNPNPYYGQQNQFAQMLATREQQLQQMQSQFQQTPQSQGLQGLGGALGNFGGLGIAPCPSDCRQPSYNHLHVPGLRNFFKD